MTASERDRGIIPARAGFTWRSRAAQKMSSGSSPLARGLRRRGLGRRCRGWIIPARAGFTQTRRGWVRWLGDHPRSRGVYKKAEPPTLRTLGSSPLARGLRSRRRFRVQRWRIIPARAGFTPSPRSRGRRSADHPRSRGVYRAGVCGCQRCPGSSPLARGLRPPGLLASSRRRIIPARAGFTRRCAPRRQSSRDHPRSRGVYCRLVTRS